MSELFFAPPPWPGGSLCLLVWLNMLFCSSSLNQPLQLTDCFCPCWPHQPFPPPPHRTPRPTGPTSSACAASRWRLSTCSCCWSRAAPGCRRTLPSGALPSSSNSSKEARGRVAHSSSWCSWQSQGQAVDQPLQGGVQLALTSSPPHQPAAAAVCSHHCSRPDLSNSSSSGGSRQGVPPGALLPCSQIPAAP